jgi:predicted metal-binding protein
MSASVILHLCSTCEPSGSAATRETLQRALRGAGLDATILPQACMNACAAPVSLALQGEGRATYFFAGIDPAADRADIVATVRAYLACPDGWIEDARACGRLRHCLKGRIPALPRG